MNKFGQDFGHDSREPAQIAKALETNTRKKNFLMERGQLLRRKVDLQLQLKDLVDRHDELVVQAASAKAHIAAGKKTDPDYESLKNGLAVAKTKAAELKSAIVEKQGRIDAVQAKIDENLSGLKLAIDSEIGRAGRAEVKAILERAANDAMALCGELRSKLEAFAKYGEGLCDDAAANLDQISEFAEQVWRSAQKV